MENIKELDSNMFVILDEISTMTPNDLETFKNIMNTVGQAKQNPPSGECNSLPTGS